MKKTIIASMLLLLSAGSMMAQSGTNSPYSQFALGALSEQSSGFNRGMNGVGIGFHEHAQINYLNPASYAELDSLTFLFDAGLAGQITNFKEGDVKKNANNADFEYVVGGFRLFRHLGLSFGILPYTNIGYSYAVTKQLDDADKTTSTNTYSGSGGLHQIYLGFGWSPFRNFSIGVNGSYLYGSYTRSAINSYSSSYVNTLSRQYSADVRSYKLDFGAQYMQKLSNTDFLTLGLTYSPGHSIGGKPTLLEITSNSQTSVSDTTTYPGAGQANLKLEIPTTFGVGLMYNHSNQLKVGLDYTLQKWADVDAPAVENNNGTVSYVMQSGQYKNRHKVTVGADYCPNAMGRHIYQRIHYRAGVSYATPYYYIYNGSGIREDGPKEFNASLGFGIPIINTWNNRSTLNISAQWAHQSATGFISENTFRINIGLTFNERWFAKWKLN